MLLAAQETRKNKHDEVFILKNLFLHLSNGILMSGTQSLNIRRFQLDAEQKICQEGKDCHCMRLAYAGRRFFFIAVHLFAHSLTHLPTHSTTHLPTHPPPVRHCKSAAACSYMLLGFGAKIKSTFCSSFFLPRSHPDSYHWQLPPL